MLLEIEQMSDPGFVVRSFVIVPSEDGGGYEIQIEPALPDGTALAVRATYEQASHQAVEWAKIHGGGISQTRSRK